MVCCRLNCTTVTLTTIVWGLSSCSTTTTRTIALGSAVVEPIPVDDDDDDCWGAACRESYLTTHEERLRLGRARSSSPYLYTTIAGVLPSIERIPVDDDDDWGGAAVFEAATNAVLLTCTTIVTVSTLVLVLSSTATIDDDWWRSSLEWWRRAHCWGAVVVERILDDGVLVVFVAATNAVSLTGRQQCHCVDLCFGADRPRRTPWCVVLECDYEDTGLCAVFGSTSADAPETVRRWTRSSVLPSKACPSMASGEQSTTTERGSSPQRRMAAAVIEGEGVVSSKDTPETTSVVFVAFLGLPFLCFLRSVWASCWQSFGVVPCVRGESSLWRRCLSFPGRLRASVSGALAGVLSPFVALLLSLLGRCSRRFFGVLRCRSRVCRMPTCLVFQVRLSVGLSFVVVLSLSCCCSVVVGDAQLPSPSRELVSVVVPVLWAVVVVASLGVARLPFGYLVDPASSHMLVSKIKPCMCKYKRLNRETANGSLNQL